MDANSQQADAVPPFASVSGYVPPVLDACCGPRMMWFDRADRRAVYADRRSEVHTVPDRSHGREDGTRAIVVAPDVVADFTALPFASDTFAHVVFDPPHLTRAGADSWMAKKYGKLTGEWRDMLARGFSECFRVLRPHGTLIFKWNETHVPLADILALTTARPLYGHRSGAKAKTHWVAFIKPGDEAHNDKADSRPDKGARHE